MSLKIKNLVINESGENDITEDFELDTDTYDLEYSKDLINLIEENIVELFLLDNCYSLEYLIQYIETKLKRKVNKVYIYLALSRLIKNKVEISNRFNQSGLIIYRNKFYCFQPSQYNNNFS